MDGIASRAASRLPLVSLVVAMAATATHAQSPLRLAPIPDKLVVLTFDDSKASHYTVVRPLLKKYGFGATFFITEGFGFRTNKDDYLTSVGSHTARTIRGVHEVSP